MTLMERLRASLSQIASRLSTGGDDQQADKKADEEVEAGKPSRTAASTAALREGLQKIRDDLAGFGTAVGVIAGSVTAVAVFATFDDLYPLPRYSGDIVFSVVLLLAVATAASGELTRRFFAARRRVVVDPSLFSVVDPNNVTEEERPVVEAFLQHLARGEGARSPRAVELRVQRLQRVSARAALQNRTELAKAAAAEAQRLDESVELAAVAGVVSLVERRSGEVYRSPVAVILAATIVLANAGIFLVGEWSQGRREQITAWIACQKDADDAIQDEVCRDLDPRASLPTSPPTSASTPKPTPTPDAVIYQLNSCAAVPDSDNVPRELRLRALEVCAGLERASVAPNPSPTG